MRIPLILIICLLFVACTSMLLGNNSSGENNPAGTSQGATNEVEDDAISESILRAFRDDPKLSQYAIKVRTVDGHVIISGTVGSYTARDQAIELASQIDGPASVSYRIGVNTRL